jgi:hypothetical protein
MTKINYPKTQIAEWAAFNLSKRDWFVHNGTTYYTLESTYKEVTALCIRDCEIVKIDGQTMIRKVNVTLDVDYIYV